MLRRFYIYRFLIYFYLWLPVSVIYMQEMRGLSLTQIAAMSTPAWIAAALAEVPTGGVADAWGRRISLAIGALLYGVAFIGKGLGTSWTVLLIFSILQPVAFTFISGADMAWLYDTLKAEGREQEFVRHQGRSTSVMYLAQGLAALLGSWLAQRGLHLPFLGAGVLCVVAAGVALTLREPSAGQAGAPGRTRASLAQTCRDTLQLTQGSRETRYAMLYSAATYFVPFLLFYVLFQPYAQSAGLPAAWIGAALVALRVISLTGASLADRVRGRVGELPLLWLVPLIIGGAVGLSGVVPLELSLALVAGVIFLNAVHRPVVAAVLNRQLESRVRATVLSGVSLLSSLLVAGVEPLLGAVADGWGVPAMLGAMGLLAALLAYAVLVLWRPGLTARPASVTLPSSNT